MADFETLIGQFERAWNTARSDRFGDSVLRYDGAQVHHVIPAGLFASGWQNGLVDLDPGQRLIIFAELTSGVSFRLNDAQANGIALADNAALSEALGIGLHSGPHDDYSDAQLARLNELARDQSKFGTSFTDDASFRALLTGSAPSELRAAVSSALTDHVNATRYGLTIGRPEINTINSLSDLKGAWFTSANDPYLLEALSRINNAQGTNLTAADLLNEQAGRLTTPSYSAGETAAVKKIADLYPGQSAYLYGTNLNAVDASGNPLLKAKSGGTFLEFVSKQTDAGNGLALQISRTAASLEGSSWASSLLDKTSRAMALAAVVSNPAGFAVEYATESAFAQFLVKFGVTGARASLIAGAAVSALQAGGAYAAVRNGYAYNGFGGQPWDPIFDTSKMLSDMLFDTNFFRIAWDEEQDIGAWFTPSQDDEIVITARNIRHAPFTIAFDGEQPLVLVTGGLSIAGADSSERLQFTHNGERAAVLFERGADGGLAIDPSTGRAIPYVAVTYSNNALVVHYMSGPRAGESDVIKGADNKLREIVSDLTEGKDTRNDAAVTIGAAIAEINNIEQAGELGRQFSSIIASVLPIENPLTRILASAVLGTIAENLAEAIKAGGFEKVISEDVTYNILGNVFEELGGNLAAAGAGAISSILVADLVDSLGLEGTLVGDAVQTGLTNYLTTLITHLPEIVDGTFNYGSLSQVNTSATMASFIGHQIAQELVEFDTIEGQIGVAIGRGIGSILATNIIKAGASTGNPWAFAIAVVVAVVVEIVGGLIGSLFGGKAKAAADLGWNERDQRFSVVSSWSKNHGNRQGAVAMGNTVANIFNSVIEQTGAHVLDGQGIRRGAYGHVKSQWVYYASAGPGSGSITYGSGNVDDVITHGVYLGLSDMVSRLVGGDVYLKRALAATIDQAGGDPNSNYQGAAGAFSTEALLGNFAIAKDYAAYLQNSAAINALIAAEPTSAFTAGWTITFARVMELGLDKRGRTDWIGGWNVFLDETKDGALDGEAFAPGNLVLELDPQTHERLFVFVDNDGSLLGVLGDTIDTASKDVITGTSGNDALTVNSDVIALSSALTLNGAAAPNGAHKIRVAALIDGGAGDDVIRGGDLGNDLLGGDGNDTLIGGKLDDWALGGAGNDTLYAAESYNAASNGDYLDGGDGDDALYGSAGSDWLAGGAGVDRILGGAGGDIIAGGAGDEKGSNGEALLQGGAGSDQYLFTLGDGADVVFDESDPNFGAHSAQARLAGMNAGNIQRNWAGKGAYQADGSVVGGEDAIAFGAGIDMRDLVIRRGESGGVANDDLIIEIVGRDGSGNRVATGDSITIQKWFDTARRVEWLRFADGTEIRIGDVGSFVVGTAANDVIIGSYGSDFLLGGAGDDTMWGLSGNDFGFGGKGRDFVSGDGDNDWVLGGDDADKVIGGAGNDTVFGDGGDDDVYGGAGSDIVAGGRGFDQVVAGAGNDLIKFERGDGRDVVFDDYSNAWDLVYAGGAYTNGYALDGQGRVVKNGDIYWQDGVWLGVFDWDDAAGALKRHLGADANGRLTGNAGDDTLEFGLDIDIQDVQVRRVGLDVEIAIGQSEDDAAGFDAIADHVLLKEFFAGGAGQIEHFVFIETGRHDVANWNIGAFNATDGDDVIAGTAAINWLTGGLGDDAITGGSAGDILSGNQGDDVLNGAGGADVLYGGAGADVIDGGAGADTIFGGGGLDVASYASDGNAGAGVRASLKESALNTRDAMGDVYDGIEGLEGTSRADKLMGNAGANSLKGGAGDDLLQGDGGDDSYEIGRSDGADVIADGKLRVDQVLDVNGALNTALFTAHWTDLGLAQVMGVYWRSYRLVVKRNATGEEIYRSRDGVDFLFGSAQASAPAGGAWPFANGQWLTGAYRANGVETVLESFESGEGGSDTIELGEDVSLADLTAAWENSGKDVRLSIAGGGQILIKDQNQADRRVETLITGDGLAVDLTQLKLAGESATSEADLFLGNASADIFAGGAGDDALSGGDGDDSLDGGDGDDSLEGGAGADTLSGGADSVTTDHAAAANGADYGDTLRYVSSNAGVTIDLATGAASGGHAQGDVISGIENVIGSAFADALTGDAGANRLAGLAGNDALSGGAGDDILVGGLGDDSLSGGAGADALSGDEGDDAIDGGAGADVIAGGAGADQIAAGEDDDRADGGDGNDILYGGAGKDSLGGGDGHDALHGEDGDDALSGEAGNDALAGGAGDDTLAGGAGFDALDGGAGDDIYVFDAQSGADSIVDADGANRIAISGIASADLWLARVGDDLKITAKGNADFAITVVNYFAVFTPSRVREIATQDASLFLGYAGGLITAMTAIAATAPATIPASVVETLSNYWHAGGKAAPRVAAQNLTVNEDTLLTGAVGAIDHDENISSYEAALAPAHGTLTLNQATGTWSYLADSNYYGADSFKIRVTDGDGHSVVQDVGLTIASVNDAPHDITVTNPVASIAERDRPQNGVALDAIVLAILSASDVDAPDGGDFADFVFSVTDPRFEIADGNVLRLKAGAALDYEAGAMIDVAVTVTDRAGSGLSFTKSFSFAIADADDYLYGTVGADALTGQAGKNVIQGNAGDDVITGAGAIDRLEGGDGADVLIGLGGADILIGGANNDVLDGGDGDDRLDGGAGDDLLKGGAGADTFLGGAGVDTVSYADAAAAITVNLATLAGTQGEANGDVFEDAPEMLIGSAYDDTLTGNDDANAISGGAGADAIFGGEGADSLYGEAGDDLIDGQGGGDLLVGGAGADILIGGTGSDAYIIEASSGADEIRNFDPDGLDIDVLGYRDIDRSRLWFARSGDNLVISVIGTNTITTIRDWYVIADEDARANYKVDFILAGQHFSSTIDADGLVALMAGHEKPADLTAYDALHADLAFENQWAHFWDANGAPIVSDILAQSLNEDGTLTLTLRATDDVTPVTGITMNVIAVRMDDETTADLSIVAAPTIGAADSNGDHTLTVSGKANASGQVKIKVQAVDPGGLLTEKIFVLTVAPVADAPVIVTAAPVAPAAPLTKPTLDNGAWGLNIAAALIDSDGSETLEVQISGVPSGLAFNRGTDLGGGTWSFTPAQLSGLQITGPAAWSQDVALTVTAIARESATGETAETQTTLNVVFNARPTHIAVSALAIAENSANGTALAIASSTDADGGETFTYALTNNAGGRFQIDAATGAISVANGALLNYEAAASHVIRVKTTDSGGLSFEKDFTITLADVNEAPTDIVLTNTLTSIAENSLTASRIKVADLAVTDDALGSATLGLSGADAGSFEIDGNALYLKAGVVLNYEAKASYSVTVAAVDAGAGGAPDVSKAFTLNVTNVDEAPSAPALTIGGTGFTMYEREGLTPGVPVTNLAGQNVYITSADPEGSALVYEIATTSSGYGKFSIGADGRLYQQADIDYDAGPRSYTLDVRAWDGGAVGVGNSSLSTINVDVANVAPVITSAKFTRYAFTIWAGNAYFNFVGNQFTTTLSEVVATQSVLWSTSPLTLLAGPSGATITSQNGTRIPSWTIRYAAQDASGASMQATLVWDGNLVGGVVGWAYVSQGYVQILPPIVLDLDGDGIELTSLSASQIAFDMNGDGALDGTGWVGADDGVLTLDRDGDGLITNGREIAFRDDVDAAVSDLEGLRAYDSNQNGLLDAGDADFSMFRVWRDANQDGVSQAGELQGLDALGIAAINLTLNLTPSTTGQNQSAGDNVIYGYGAFARSDGSVGAFGDVALAFTPGANLPQDIVDALTAGAELSADQSAIVMRELERIGAPMQTETIELTLDPPIGQLAPVVLDLDGGGAALISRTASNVLFDADNDAVRQRIGWMGAGAGVLALDRNQDGVIGSGAEISFSGDLAGAVSDLEGLAAYDTNGNGLFDGGDARFGEFLIWQDGDQDGVSQSDELRSLAFHNIAAINLTRQVTGASNVGASDNVVLATSSFIRVDGSSGEVLDASFAYDRPSADPEDAANAVDRLADHAAQAQAARGRTSKTSARALTDALAELGYGDARTPVLPEAAHARAPAALKSPRGLFTRIADLFGGKTKPSDEPVAAMAGGEGSALHQGLGVADKRVLHMVNAMASFDPKDSADLSRGGKDPRVADLLTSLPDLRKG